MTSDPVSNEVSRLINLLSRQYGGQASFARTLGLSGSAVTSWKNLKTRPDEQRWEQLEEYFGLPEGHFEAIANGSIEVGAVTPSSINRQVFRPEYAPHPAWTAAGMEPDEVSPGQIVEFTERRLAELLKDVQAAAARLQELVETVESLAATDASLERRIERLEKRREGGGGAQSAP